MNPARLELDPICTHKSKFSGNMILSCLTQSVRDSGVHFHTSPNDTISKKCSSCIANNQNIPANPALLYSPSSPPSSSQIASLHHHYWQSQLIFLWYLLYSWHILLVIMVIASWNSVSLMAERTGNQRCSFRVKHLRCGIHISSEWYSSRQYAGSCSAKNVAQRRTVIPNNCDGISMILIHHRFRLYHKERFCYFHKAFISSAVLTPFILA